LGWFIEPVDFWDFVETSFKLSAKVGAALDFKNPQTDDKGFYYDIVEVFEGCTYSYTAKLVLFDLSILDKEEIDEPIPGTPMFYTKTHPKVMVWSYK
jgi:hypothetical protein